MKKPLTFGKYLLLERVNVGGMAEVFLGKAFGGEGFEKLFAIKRILPTMVEDEEFISMFLDEARISVQLNHAHVVQIHELGKYDDSFYIAMEYVSGRDLRHLFERYRKRKELMSTAQAVFIASKMCEGLDYAHRKKDASGMDLNIVHRDISPQNILVSFQGEVKIIDFGIAKAANRAQKTQAGILKGKFGYMSPEQVRGLAIDRRSDLFAVGVILYEMLTGEKLFVGESDFSTLEKVRNADVLPPRQYNSKIPVALEKVVMKALARDVEDRYQWCSELREDLVRFLLSGDTIYSSRQLMELMRETFAEEYAQEMERLERWADVQRPEDMESSEVTATPVSPPRPDVRSHSQSGALRRRPGTPAPRISRTDPNNAALLETGPEDLPDEAPPNRTQIVMSGAVERPRPPAVRGPPVGLGADLYDEDEATAMGQSPGRSSGPSRSGREDGAKAVPTPPPGGARPPEVNGKSRLAESDETTPRPSESPGATLPPRHSGLRAAVKAPTREMRGPRDVPAKAAGDSTQPPRRDLRASPPVLQRAPVETEYELDELEKTGAHGVLSARPRPVRVALAALLVGVVAVIAFAKLGGSPSGAHLTIRATPESAGITVDGAAVQGLTAVSLAAGIHTVVVAAQGYRTATKEVTLERTPVFVELALEKESAVEPPPPESASATAKSPEAPAPHATDLPGAGTDPAAESPEREEVSVEAAEAPKRKNFDLKIESEPTHAEIEIAGRKFGKTPRTLTAVDPRKAKEVKLTLKGYAAAVRPVPWDGEQPEVVVFAILEKLHDAGPVEKPTPKEAAPRQQAEGGAIKAKERPRDPPKEAAPRGFGKIITSSSPVAKVFLDGKETGRSTPIAPAKPLDASAGEHVLTYEAPDGRKATRKVTVRAGETEKIVGVTDFE